MTVAEYRNEMLDRCLGQWVVIQQLTAPEFDMELTKAIKADPTSAKKELLHSRTAVRELVGYDQVGVALRTPEHPLQVFVPWSAVLEIVPLEQ
jgi:hypothetical protein